MSAADLPRRARQMLRAPVAMALRALEPRRFRYELAVCAIFREEAPFFDEWIRFHMGVGAEHFYLYNNFSTDDYAAVLAPWIARGVVTVIDWPVPVGQLAAYRDAIRRTHGACRWVAFIDIDEFLFSPQTRDIRPILREFADWPAVVVWQLFFGADGHDARPPTPVTLSYRRRAGLERTTAKSIVNPRRVYRVGIHLFKFWDGEGRDTDGRVMTEGLGPTLERLRINHYWSRSLEDLRTKVARGDASTDEARHLPGHLLLEQKLNAEPDEVIVPLAEAILGEAGQAAR